MVTAEETRRADILCVDRLIAAVGELLKGQRVYAEVLAQHLVSNDSAYGSTDGCHAAHHVMSPLSQAPEHQGALWRGPQSGMIQTTATYCCFCTAQKEMGKDNLRKVPNGTNGVEDQMSVLWHHELRTGRLTPNEFVRVNSASCAQISNIYSVKRSVQVGADADIVVWDPESTRRIPAETHHQNIDFNIYAGREAQGLARTTLGHGKVVWHDGDMRMARGAGRDVDRPCAPAYFEAAATRRERQASTAVKH